jgi:hypothetical protein
LANDKEGNIGSDCFHLPQAQIPPTFSFDLCLSQNNGFFPIRFSQQGLPFALTCPTTCLGCSG